MKLRLILPVILGSITLLALPASAETPLLEELMRKYTFPFIFLQLLMVVLTVGYLYFTGLLPKAIFVTKMLNLKSCFKTTISAVSLPPYE